MSTAKSTSERILGFAFVQEEIGIVTATMLVGLAIMRIIATYAVFCQTYDEPAHLARGEQWLNGRTYTYPLHPPLAPLTFALGPTLSGIQINPVGDRWVDGNAILYARDYHQTLALARLGNLIFLIWAVIAAWCWCREYYGLSCAVAAVFVLTMFPAILANASLATTDMAITAALTMSLWMAQRWFDQPNCIRSILLGVCLGLTMLSKHSSIVFLPATLLVVAVFYRPSKIDHHPINLHLFHAAALIASLCLVVWIGYRCSIGPIYLPDIAWDEKPQMFEHVDEASSVYRWLLTIPIPAPEYFRGLAVLFDKNDLGHSPYFWGSASGESCLAFFPVVLAIKLPIAFGVALASSLLINLRRFTQRNSHIPFLCSLAILSVAMTSKINLGIRHLLPLYPLFAIWIGIGVSRLWDANTAIAIGCESQSPGALGWPPIPWAPLYFKRLFILALAICGAAESIAAHPDYLAYFNLFAGEEPENIVVGSDLDWGQDLDRLAKELFHRKIDHVYLAYFGTADTSKHGLPRFDDLSPNVQVHGCVAVSLTTLKRDAGYHWLNDYKPVARIGHSIMLYHIPE